MPRESKKEKSSSISFHYATVSEFCKDHRRNFVEKKRKNLPRVPDGPLTFRGPGDKMEKIWSPKTTSIPARLKGISKNLKPFSQVWAQFGLNLNLNTDFHGLKGFPQII